MAENTKPPRTILSTRCFSRAESIDGGDTIILHFRCADGRDAAVMIPRKAAQTARQALEAELAKSVSPHVHDAGSNPLG